MEKLFVYGTLRQSKIQKKLLNRIVSFQVDALQDFKKGNIEINGNTYAIAVPKKGSVIEGKVIDITLDELALIDKYETSAYQRTKATLLSGQSAWVYCGRLY